MDAKKVLGAFRMNTDAAFDSLSNAFDYEIQFEEYLAGSEEEQVLESLNDENEQAIAREMDRF